MGQFIQGESAQSSAIPQKAHDRDPQEWQNTPTIGYAENQRFGDMQLGGNLFYDPKNNQTSYNANAAYDLPFGSAVANYGSDTGANANVSAALNQYLSAKGQIGQDGSIGAGVTATPIKGLDLSANRFTPSKQNPVDTYTVNYSTPKIPIWNKGKPTTSYHQPKFSIGGSATQQKDQPTRYEANANYVFNDSLNAQVGGSAQDKYWDAKASLTYRF